MYTSVSNQINQKTMELAKAYKPDLSQFDNGKSFSELYNSGETFCQVFLYDRHEGYTGYQSKFNINLDQKEAFENAMKLYEEKLKECQEVAVNEFGIDEFKSRGYYYNNRVGIDFGFCHVSLHVRSEEKDNQDRLMNESYHEDHEVECGICGDGGCPSCQPQWFI